MVLSLVAWIRWYEAVHGEIQAPQAAPNTGGDENMHKQDGGLDDVE